MLIYIITIILLVFFYTRCKKTIITQKHRLFETSTHRKGGLPIVGHGISFSKDIIGFVKKCYQEYGKVFQLKIFNKKHSCYM